MLGLWWVMAAGAVVIFVLVHRRAVYATLDRARAPPATFAGISFIIGGGVALPGRGAARAPVLQLRARPRPQPAMLGPDALRIEVVGKQWWWEVRYLEPGGGAPVVSRQRAAPAGRRAGRAAARRRPT